MTSQQYLQLLLVPQPLSKEAGLNPIAEMGLYMAPVTGEILSARDAALNVGGMFKAIAKGNGRKALTQGGQAVGNTLMMLAGLIPGGSSIRTAVRAGRIAKGTKALGRAGKLIKGVNKISDGADVAKLALKNRTAARLLKLLGRTGKSTGASGKLAREGLSSLMSAKSIDALADLARVNSSKLKGMKGQRNAYVRGTRDYKNFKAQLAAQKNLTRASQSAAGFGRGALRQAPRGAMNLRGLEGALQGRMVGGVGRRLTDGQLKAWEAMARNPMFKTYGRAQMGGLATVMGSSVPEQTGWATPRQVPPTGTQRFSEYINSYRR